MTQMYTNWGRFTPAGSAINHIYTRACPLKGLDAKFYAYFQDPFIWMINENYPPCCTLCTTRTLWILPYLIYSKFTQLVPEILCSQEWNRWTNNPKPINNTLYKNILSLIFDCNTVIQHSLITIFSQRMYCRSYTTRCSKKTKPTVPIRTYR